MLTFLEHSMKDDALWDVCCDHGYVGIRALQSGEYTEVHFVDKIPHIMDRLEQLILQSSRKNKCPYELHLMSGEDLERRLSGTVLIAGVGGMTIRTIIDSLIDKELLLAGRLLLSPHTDEKVLVAYMQSQKFKDRYLLIDKIMMPEGSRFRPLYIFNEQKRRPNSTDFEG